jgi:ADP-heptose:LPS heptosyltransferase
LSLAFQLPLSDLAMRLAVCEAFVGHDSGITHLAAALGLPVLALWGDTNQAVWRPRGDQARILPAPTGLANLEVAQVLHALGTLPPRIRLSSP